MPLYEHVFLARQDISSGPGRGPDEGIHRASSRKPAARIGKTEYWGLKTVAFKIKKNRKAHYSLMNLDAPAGRHRRDGAAHGPVARRHPLHHHPRRRARDRALHPDAQERPRRAGRDGDRGGFRGDRGGFRGGDAAASVAAAAVAAAASAAAAAGVPPDVREDGDRGRAAASAARATPGAA